ncbi:CLOCK-interacting pacemaker-like isoform X2 [Echeneis naucrates]|uniref:CLOCK-interacting pacemaker-like isoform X2 n=1 Tax=Echeneis naucrates TaxID=173247 RepID=UPI0011133BCC|nr:CLOCK-interacting pacemaker-like isoform X2 [Echeneis naucrates]
MPKEQGHFEERAAHSTSKNAKDKSNSATLRAYQNRAHIQPSGAGDMNNCTLHCDSEKDSGYSEDQRSGVSKPHRESSKNLNNNSVNAAGHNTPPYEELVPIYIIKNLVVKPSRQEQLLHGPLAWGRAWHALSSAKAPTQLVLIQQPAMPVSSTTTPTPSSDQAAPDRVKTEGNRRNQNHSIKNSYLPILNSYPRIAPHPRKESHEGKATLWVEGVKETGSEGQSHSKRACIAEEKNEALSTTSHLLKPQQHQKEGRVHSSSQYKGRGRYSSFPISSHSPLPSNASSPKQHKSHHCQQSSSSNRMGSSSVSSSQTPSPPSSSNSPSSSSPSPSSSTAHSPYRLAPDSYSIRQRRFLNTAEILNQSGLLAITLRTKELLEQNAATEREIAQLRQHTHLLCQVAEANQRGFNNGSDSLDKLLQVMSESASYPNLDIDQLKVLSNSHQQSQTRTEKDKEKDNNKRMTMTLINPLQVVSLHKIDHGTSPPSPLFAPSPYPEDTHHDKYSLDIMSTSVSYLRSALERGSRQEIKEVSDLN